MDDDTEVTLAGKAERGDAARRPVCNTSDMLARWCGLLRERTHATVESLALFAQPHRRINLQEFLIDILLAREASTERSLFEPVKSPTQLIDARVALEREQCIDLPKRELASYK